MTIHQIIAKLRGNTIGGIFARQASGSFIINIGGLGLAYVLEIFLARLLGAKPYGDYTYVMSWVNVLATWSLLGLDTSSVRFLSTYFAQKEWSLFRGMLIRGNQIVIGCSILLAIIMAIIVWIVRDRLGTSLVWTFSFGCLFLPLTATGAYQSAKLRALKKIVLSQFPIAWIDPLMRVIGMLLLIVLGYSPSAPNAMLASVMASIAVLGLTILFFLREKPIEANAALPAYRTKEWMQVSLPMLVTSGLVFLSTQANIIMVGTMLGTKEAGIFAAADRLALLITISLTAVNSIAAPLFAELAAQQNYKQLQRIVVFASVSVIVATLPSVLLLIFGGYWLLSIFGKEFVSAYGTLLIIVFGQVVNVASGPTGNLMAMTGHQNYMMKVISVALVINILLNLILIPIFGIEGAALTRIAVLVFWNVAFVSYIWRSLNINPTIFSVLRRIGQN